MVFTCGLRVQLLRPATSLGLKLEIPRQGIIMKVPREIIMNIFLNLPSFDIQSCSYVCKEWRDIVLDPFFAEAHYKNSNSICVSYTNKPQTIVMKEYYQPRDGELEEFETFEIHEEFTKVKRIINVCRGFLLLLVDFASLCVYNPLNKEYTKLPVPQSVLDGVIVGKCGMGFSPSTNCYKVAKLWYTRDSSEGVFNWRVEVYTLGTIAWREIKEVAYCDDERMNGLTSTKIKHDEKTIDLNGYLHWLAGDTILCFNLEREELNLVPFPCIEHCKVRKSKALIGVLENQLSLTIVVHGISRHEMQVWVLNDYGVEEDSWALRVSVKESINLTSVLHMEPVISLVDIGDRGELIFLATFGFYSYDLSKKQWERMGDYFGYNRPWCVSNIFVPSFFSLRNFASSSKVQVLRLQRKIPHPVHKSGTGALKEICTLLSNYFLKIYDGCVRKSIQNVF